MTRTGKIARLPSNIREKLNVRLENGEQGKALVEWLNSLDQVRRELEENFGGRPINEQNLSDWKQGGFVDWQREEETCESVFRLAEFSENLDASAGERSISDRLAGVLAAQLAAETTRLLEETTDTRERWQRLCDTLRILRGLREGDHAGARARVALERWEIEQARLEEEDKSRAIVNASMETWFPSSANQTKTNPDQAKSSSIKPNQGKTPPKSPP